MKLKIMEIEPRLVICEMVGENSKVEVARRWLTEDIQVGDVIEIKITDI